VAAFFVLLEAVSMTSRQRRSVNNKSARCASNIDDQENPDKKLS